MKREEQIFEQVLAQPLPKAREAVLLEACAGDSDLRRRVEELLAAHQDAAKLEFLQSNGTVPETAAAPPDLATEQPGDRIGPYKLLEKIGEGGCGVVYMAEQEVPVRRRVALKIIKLGLETKSVIARFEAERQALALMDHPNIAKFFDAGTTATSVAANWRSPQTSILPSAAGSARTTDSPQPLKSAADASPPLPDHATGRPYFVMELVRGLRITDYCDQKNLSTRQRLDLFIEVCHAVQHAHQKGIIHRDLKPSNILVTERDGKPVPKVIDFGIAKATEGRLTDKTLFTQFAALIGTPAYMSPEQAEMTSRDIDTRSDIYSLGVLLYELLTGTTPFDTKELLKAGIDELRRVIREVEPPTPSTRLATRSAKAPTRVAQPSRLRVPGASSPRGATGGETPPGPAGGTPDATPTLNPQPKLLSTDLDWIVMKCLEKDRGRRYETANGLAADLQRHLDHDPVLARAPSAAYRFQKWVRRNKLIFAATSAVLATLLSGIVVSSWQAVRATRSERLAAGRLVESETARKDAEAISTFLAEVFQSPDPKRGDRTTTVAEALGRATTKIEKELADQPERQAKLWISIGATYSGLGLDGEAVPLLEKARDYYLRTHGSEYAGTLKAAHSLAIAYQGADRRDEALKLGETTLQLRRKTLGPEHPDTLASMTQLANSYGNGKEERLKMREEVLRLSRKVNGPEHPATLIAINNLAGSYDKVGRKAEALKMCEELLSICRRVSGPEHPNTLLAMTSLAKYYDEFHRVDEAIRLGEEGLRLSRKVRGPEHGETIDTLANLVFYYGHGGRLTDQHQLLNEGLSNAAVLSPSRRARLLDTRADVLGRMGHFEEAAADQTQALAAYPQSAGSYHVLAALLVHRGDEEGYRKLCQEELTRFGDTKDPKTAERMLRDCLLRADSGAVAQAVAAWHDLIIGAMTNSGWFPSTKGLCEYRHGHFAAAIEWARQGLSQTNLSLDLYATAVIAMAQHQLGQRDSARATLAQASTLAGQLPRLDSGDLGHRWWDSLICRALLREAKELIEGPTVKATEATKEATK